MTTRTDYQKGDKQLAAVEGAANAVINLFNTLSTGAAITDSAEYHKVESDLRSGKAWISFEMSFDHDGLLSLKFSANQTNKKPVTVFKMVNQSN